MARTRRIDPVMDHTITRVRIGQNKATGQFDCRHPYQPNEPSGYLAWGEWAEQKAKTHDCSQCPDCGLWSIYTPKRRTPSRGRSGA